MNETFKKALTIGMNLWPTVIRGSSNDSDAFQRTIQHILGDLGQRTRDEQRLASITFTVRGEELATIDPNLAHTLFFASKWVDGGCRTIMPFSKKYFAAMAQTNVGNAGPELHVPFPVFAVQIPAGLIVGADGLEYEMGLFGQASNFPAMRSDRGEYFAEKVSFYALWAKNGTAIHAFWPDMSLADLLFVEGDVDPLISRTGPLDMDRTESDLRIVELVKRAVVGMLYTMQHTPHWTEGPSVSSGTGNDRRGTPPAHRTIVVGRPIDVDVTSSVSNDARTGGHAAPSVQTLVRGHLKRQVIGEGRTGRKVIWVEPYWRGPEDAPILARPYRVGTKQELPADTNDESPPTREG